MLLRCAISAKKHHWQVAGPTFYQLHLLFEEHYDEQNEIVDAIAERMQLLGGVSIAMAADVAEMTLIPRPPKGCEEAPVNISPPPCTRTKSSSKSHGRWRASPRRAATTERMIRS